MMLLLLLLLRVLLLLMPHMGCSSVGSSTASRRALRQIVGVELHCGGWHRMDGLCYDGGGCRCHSCSCGC